MIKSTTINRESLKWLFEQPLEVRYDALQNHLAICQLIINQFFEEELNLKAGPRYKHDTDGEYAYSRYGYNPGSVYVGNKKLPLNVPRLLHNSEERFESPEAYKTMRAAKRMDADELSRGVLLGLSTRDYAGVIDHLREGFGLSKSSVSKNFIKETSEKVKEFECRQFHDMGFVALFIDGKHLAHLQMIIVLGITDDGRKVPLGLVQAASENHQVMGDLFDNLIERGLQYKQGLLFIIDGSKGIKKAILKTFGDYAFIQRCIWHKRENILTYLPEKEHEYIKSLYHQALNEDTYEFALKGLQLLNAELYKLNVKAAASLEEGMEELLTLHKLDLKKEFSKSFSTTNCIENVNSQLVKYIGKVKYWKNSDERYRWIIAALLIIEKRMWRVINFNKLELMKEALERELKKRLVIKKTEIIYKK